MKASRLARVLLGIALVVASIAYLIVVDLGVSAGRIHEGVNVSGFDLGGLTEAEATDLLAARKRELKRTPIVFRGSGVACRFTAADAGWGPQPHDSAAAAMRVGRSGWISAIAERTRAWVRGVEIDWPDQADPAKVGGIATRCLLRARDAGLAIDRSELERRIEAAIKSWPRSSYDLPLTRA